VSSPFAPLRAHGLGLCFGARKQEVGEAGELRGGAHGAPPRWGFQWWPAGRRSRPAGFEPFDGRSTPQKEGYPFAANFL